MKIIPVKILGTKRSQRYLLARTLIQARTVFEKEHPECQLDVQEVATSQEILNYTPVIAFQSLMIGEKLVCVGRFPTKNEILAWLDMEIQQVGAG
jgi:hypothetical protein